jgi:hypothetical protein
MRRDKAKERFAGCDVDATIVKAAHETICKVVTGELFADGS